MGQRNQLAEDWRDKVTVFPGLVVIDLDFTLWDCGGTWVDCTTPPFDQGSDGVVKDQTGAKMKLYDDIREILEFLQEKEVPLAIASRTHAPSDALRLLDLLGVDKCFQFLEIYPGSKRSHFEHLRQDSGVPFGQMVFFDDEQRNIDEITALGVESVFVRSGLTWPVLRRTLQTFSSVHSQ